MWIRDHMTDQVTDENFAGTNNYDRKMWSCQISAFKDIIFRRSVALVVVVTQI